MSRRLEDGQDYGACIARALAAARSRLGEPNPDEEGQAKEAVQELLRLPESTRRERIGSDLRLRSLPAWQQLLSRAQARLPWQPRRAEDLARHALAVACRLDPQRYGDGLPADCRVLSAIAVVRARLAAGHVSPARRALRAAEAFLDGASGDPYVRAEVDLTRAAVARAEGSLRLARTCLRRAAARFATLGEPGREAAARAEEAEVFHAIQGRPPGEAPDRPRELRGARLRTAPAGPRGRRERR